MARLRDWWCRNTGGHHYIVGLTPVTYAPHLFCLRCRLGMEVPGLTGADVLRLMSDEGDVS